MRSDRNAEAADPADPIHPAKPVARSTPPKFVAEVSSNHQCDLDRALRLGVQDYLVKPISPKALLLKARAIIG